MDKQTQAALKLALEALETERENYQDWDKQDGAPEYIYEAITALREALAEQPAQQDPVARSKAYDMIDRFLQNNLNSDEDYAEYSKSLDIIYTPTPAQRKPLTRDQVKAMMVENGYDQASPQERADFINGIRHGEAAHGIKV